MGKQLANKPLVEAILELKWGLKEITPGASQDPEYPLFLGRFHERVKHAYPHIEKLPAVQLPDEITPHVVKYRFRKSAGGWPVVQAGPGIATLNLTEEYHWESFVAAAREFFPKLLDAYCLDGQRDAPKFTSVILRYINAVELNFEEVNVNEFLASKLHTAISLPRPVISSPQIAGAPNGLQLLVAYPLKDPESVGSLRFAIGTRSGKPALIWELNIHSTKDVPQEAEGFYAWLTKAHDILESWFFTLIEGALEKQFEGVSHVRST